MDDTIALIEAAHRGDKEARDRLVMENMGLIWSIVRRFSTIMMVKRIRNRRFISNWKYWINEGD